MQSEQNQGERNLFQFYGIIYFKSMARTTNSEHIIKLLRLSDAYMRL